MVKIGHNLINKRGPNFFLHCEIKKTQMSSIISKQVLLNALTVIRAIEETISIHDDMLEYDGTSPPTISECDLPDHVLDPFELIRVVHGDEYTRNIEYEGDIQHIADVLESCLESSLRKQGQSTADLEAQGSDGEEDSQPAERGIQD